MSRREGKDGSIISNHDKSSYYFYDTDLADIIARGNSSCILLSYVRNNMHLDLTCTLHVQPCFQTSILTIK